MAAAVIACVDLLDAPDLSGTTSGFPSHDRVVKEHFYVSLRRFMMQALGRLASEAQNNLARQG